MISDTKDCFIQLVVHTHEDRGFIWELLDSLRAIDVPLDLAIVVSFNGDDENYSSRLEKVSGTLGFTLRRAPNGTVMEHLRYSLGQCDAKYISFLHDDDVLDPDYYGKFLKVVASSEPYGSYSCNDFTIVSGLPRYNRLRSAIVRKVTSLEVCCAYLLGRHAICFPSIVYDAERLRSADILRNTKYGKYSDVSIVLHLTAEAHGLFTLPAFGYRIHSEQDSKKRSFDKYRLNCWLLMKVVFNVHKFRFTTLKFLSQRIYYRAINQAE